MSPFPLLFVYGTLKKDFYNHFYLKDKTIYLHPFALEGFQLYLDRVDGAEYEKYRRLAKTEYDPWPYLKRSDGLVHGELYQIVNEDVLQALDKLEGVDEGFYGRELIDTVIGQCYLYVYLPPLTSHAVPIKNFTLQEQGLYQGDFS